MNETINHKRGDTFAYGGTWLLPDGPAWSARCHVRVPALIDAALPAEQSVTATLVELTEGEVAALQLTVPAGSKAYALTLFCSALKTALWPAPMLVADIEFFDPADTSMVISSSTFKILIEKDPTHT